MSGYGQVAPPNVLQPDSADKAMSVQTIEEIGAVVKAAIWSGCSQFKRILSIHTKYMKPGYKIESLFMDQKRIDLQGSNREQFIAQRQIGLDEYQASTKLLYQNIENILQVEVREASHWLLLIPTVLKLYHCQGCADLNKVIQEALIQFTLSSVYTCRLLDFFIHKGRNRLFEVGLVMERLDEDLEEDIKRRKLQNIFYTEAELIHILKSVGEALMYVQLKVRST